MIEFCLISLQREIKEMKIEKRENENTIEFQNLNFHVTNYCIGVRDERIGEDLCNDIASIALKNVYIA
jgi:aminopeptidase-like protein